jgi:LysM repeat protein
MEAVRSALLTQTAQAEEEDTVQLPTEIPATSTPVVEQPAPTDEPPPPTEPPTEAAGDFVEYTVQPGDWLFKIANDFGVDPQAIVDLNGLTSPGQVQVGMVLKIPPSTGATATPTATGSAGGTVHTVKEGEWIWSIARIYGVDPQAIIDANNLTDIDLIFPGMELVIP